MQANFQAIIAGIENAQKPAAKPAKAKPARKPAVKAEKPAAFVFPTAESMKAKTPAKAKASKAKTVKAELIAPETVKPVIAEKRNYAQVIIDTLNGRLAQVDNYDTLIALKHAERARVALNKVFSTVAFSAIFDNLIRRIAIADKSTNRIDFLSNKTLIKVIDTAVGIAQGINSELDGFTRTIGYNLSALSGLTIKDGLVSLSRSIEYDELEKQAALCRRYNCSAGTASSQSGSTRMALHALGIASVIKGKRNDLMTIANDNPRASAFAVMFDESDADEE